MPLYTNHCDHPKDDYYGPVICRDRDDLEPDGFRSITYDVYFIFGRVPGISGWESTDPTERLNPANWSYCTRYGNEGHEHSSGSVILLTDLRTLFHAWMKHVGMIVEPEHERVHRLSLITNPVS